VLPCQRGIQVWFLVVAILENTPNFFQEFPEVFSLQKPIVLPPLRDVNHTITLLDTTMDSNLWIFTVSEKYVSKYAENIAK
jgi:hypothetical protein